MDIQYKPISGLNTTSLNKLIEISKKDLTDVVTLEKLVKNGATFDVVDNGVVKIGMFVKEGNKYVLKLKKQEDEQNTFVKENLIQYVSGANPTDTYGLRDLSGNSNDIIINGATSSNFVNNKFVNNGTLFGQCVNTDFTKMTAMTIIMKLSVEKSNPWYALLAFGSFKLMEQGDSKFNLITPANPGWTTNVSMDAFSLSTDIEVAYTITSAGVAKVYINGLYSGTTSYDTTYLKKFGLTSSVIPDAWTSSFTTDYAIAIWYGYVDGLTSETVKNKYYLKNAHASSERLKIQAAICNNIYEKNSKFKNPGGITQAEVELETIPAASPSSYTPSKLKGTFMFISGTEPSEVSNRFSQLENPTNLTASKGIGTITLSWTSPGTPDAIDNTYLTNYFTKGYTDWAQDYLNKRLLH